MYLIKFHDEKEKKDFAKFLKIDRIYGDSFQIHDELYEVHKADIQRIIKKAEERAKLTKSKKERNDE